MKQLLNHSLDNNRHHDHYLSDAHHLALREGYSAIVEDLQQDIRRKRKQGKITGYGSMCFSMTGYTYLGVESVFSMTASLQEQSLWFTPIGSFLDVLYLGIGGVSAFLLAEKTGQSYEKAVGVPALEQQLSEIQTRQHKLERGRSNAPANHNSLSTPYLIHRKPQR